MPNKNLLEELKKLANENNISLKELNEKLIEKTNEEQKEKILEKITKNEKYVGRYFKKTTKKGHTKYIKVLSNFSTNEYNLECLCFVDEPDAKFEKTLGMIYKPGDEYFGKYQTNLIETTHILASNIELMEETTKEEFEEKLYNYISLLIKI